MDAEELVVEAWKAYEDARELLERGDIRDAAEKAWLAVETMRRAIMVAAGIPHEETRKLSATLATFNNIMVVLGRRDLLDKYYAFQSTLHGLSFYEGLLNEGATAMYIAEVENWLREAEKLLREAKLRRNPGS